MSALQVVKPPAKVKESWFKITEDESGLMVEKTAGVERKTPPSVGAVATIASSSPKDQEASESVKTSPSKSFMSNVRVGFGGSFGFAQNKGGHNRLQKTVWVQVAEKFTLTSSANTAMSTVQGLTPMSMADASSINQLFDQACVTMIDVYVNVSWSSAPAIGTCWALNFSPSSNSASTAVRHSLLFSASTGPVYANLSSNPTPSANGSATGLLHYKVRVPKGTAQNPAVSNETVGGGWFATTDSAANVGYLVPYVEAGGGSTISTMTIFVRLTMKARYRT